MPKYVYRCTECEEVSEKNHSMNEKLTDCETCESKNTLKKLPTAIAISYKENTTGKIVDEHIREAKEEFEIEKQRLKNQDYQND